MPRVSQDAPKAVVHVFPSESSALADQEEGGTGFIVAVPVRDVGRAVIDHTYVVTNRHVVEEHDAPAVVLPRRDGRRVPITIPKGSWWFHPNGDDDIALAPLPDPSLAEYDIAGFPVSHFIRQDQLDDLGVVIGVDVYYLGRYKVADDRPSITSLRLGNISSMPVDVLHETSKRYVQSFLVEGRSRAGFSGSPVVAMLMGPIADSDHPRSLIHLGPADFLLGIAWSHMNEWQAARVEGHAARLSVELNAGLITVAPAWRIAEILERPELVHQRQTDRTEWLTNHTLSGSEEIND